MIATSAVSRTTATARVAVAGQVEVGDRPPRARSSCARRVARSTTPIAALPSRRTTARRPSGVIETSRVSAVVGRIVGRARRSCRPAARPRRRASTTEMPSSVTAKARCSVGGERDRRRAGSRPRAMVLAWRSAAPAGRSSVTSWKPSVGSASGDRGARRSRRSPSGRRRDAQRVRAVRRRRGSSGSSAPPPPARSTVASFDSTFRTMTASSAAGDRGHVRGRVARLDRLHRQRRRVDVGDAPAGRVGDPDEAPGRDRHLVGALQLCLGRQRRAAGAARARCSGGSTAVGPADARSEAGAAVAGRGVRCSRESPSAGGGAR